MEASDSQQSFWVLDHKMIGLTARVYRTRLARFLEAPSSSKNQAIKTSGSLVKKLYTQHDKERKLFRRSLVDVLDRQVRQKAASSDRPAIPRPG
jgi:hypothetical protein